MDKEFLYELMAEFEKRDIQELTVKDGKGSIHLLKVAPVAPVSASAPLVAQSAESNASLSAAPQPALEGSENAEGVEQIRAPIVGNFYRQPAPDAPYFVNEGDRVRKGQTLCILEAMKLMNELPAEFDCEIRKVLVENRTMVEYNAPLFEVKRL